MEKMQLNERQLDKGSNTPANYLAIEPLPPVHMLERELHFGPLQLALCGTALALFLTAAGYLGSQSEALQSASAAAANTIHLVSNELPGFMTPVDPNLASGSDHVLAMLTMPPADKERLRSQLQNSSVRIGGVTLWDTFDEDSDVIRISAAGFSQELKIQHIPKRFFVPYLPGASVRLEAVTDGGGGGVTLGVSTSLGKLPLPHLQPGQSLEIALP
jgi:hypothetical protein